MMVKVVFGVVLFLACVATGTSRYRYERPSRVVEIKQGRLQGTMVEVPLTSPFSSNGDKNQVKNEPQKDEYNILSENHQKTFKELFTNPWELMLSQKVSKSCPSHNIQWVPR